MSGAPPVPPESDVLHRSGMEKSVEQSTPGLASWTKVLAAQSSRLVDHLARDECSFLMNVYNVTIQIIFLKKNANTQPVRPVSYRHSPI